MWSYNRCNRPTNVRVNTASRTVTSLQVKERFFNYALKMMSLKHTVIMSKFWVFVRRSVNDVHRDLCNVSFLHRLDGSMPDGVEISNNSFAFTRPLERNDSGVYRCEVTNDIGLRSQDVNLWVQGTFWLFHSVSYSAVVCFCFFFYLKYLNKLPFNSWG